MSASVVSLRSPAATVHTAQVIDFPGAARRRTEGAGTRPIRVLVAHGQALMRAALQVLLADEPQVALADVAANREEAVGMARRERPDVVLIDVDLPGGAIEATARILADSALCDLKVVIVAAADADERILEALRAGASGVLLEYPEPAELAQILRVLTDGRTLLAPGVASRVIAKLGSGAGRRPTDSTLRAVPPLIDAPSGRA
jgi:DNA-binding NarL/FixJ family response regulator